MRFKTNKKIFLILTTKVILCETYIMFLIYAFCHFSPCWYHPEDAHMWIFGPWLFAKMFLYFFFTSGVSLWLRRLRIQQSLLLLWPSKCCGHNQFFFFFFLLKLLILWIPIDWKQTNKNLHMQRLLIHRYLHSYFSYLHLRIWMAY